MIITVYAFLHSTVKRIDEIDTIKMTNFLGYILFFSVLIYMGTRPVAYVFGDMLNYASGFEKFQYNPNLVITREKFFGYFTKYCAQVMDVSEYIFLVCFIYLTPYYFFARKNFSEYWFFLILMTFGSFSFWSFGTNGIRNGMATSIFIWALYFYHRNKWVMYFLMLVSYQFHNSLMIPIGAFVASDLLLRWLKKPNIFLFIWLSSIPLSILGGSSWETFFGSLGLGDERVNDYLTTNKEFQDLVSSTGFRWDFVLYSSFAVFAGYYYTIKRGFNDWFYNHLYGTYMIANAFWILVIRANFSNRFAYLSWFLMAIIIVYPLLKVKFWTDHYKMLGRILLIYYLFTYIMFLRT